MKKPQILNLAQIFNRVSPKSHALENVNRRFQAFKKQAIVFRKLIHSNGVCFVQYEKGQLLLSVNSNALAAKARYQKNDWAQTLRQHSDFADLIQINVTVNPNACARSDQDKIKPARGFDHRATQTLKKLSKASGCKKLSEKFASLHQKYGQS